MQIGVITLFPEMFHALNLGITARAQTQNLLQLHYWHLRDFTDPPQHRVDDRPYGGGPGMVLMACPVFKAIHTAKTQLPDAKVIYLSPQGKCLQQSDFKTTATSEQPLIFLCGRYEGIDERIMSLIDAEWSIGDYVLTGGELAAMVIIDAITRLLPGALGDEDSAIYDSFSTGLLDHSHYTRPENFENMSVPSVLLSGDHDRILRFRLESALLNTKNKRPELWKKYTKSNI